MNGNHKHWCAACGSWHEDLDDLDEERENKKEIGLEALRKWMDTQDVSVLSAEETGFLLDTIDRFCEEVGIDLPGVSEFPPPLIIHLN